MIVQEWQNVSRSAVRKRSLYVSTQIAEEHLKFSADTSGKIKLQIICQGQEFTTQVKSFTRNTEDFKPVHAGIFWHLGAALAKKAGLQIGSTIRLLKMHDGQWELQCDEPHPSYLEQQQQRKKQQQEPPLKRPKLPANSVKQTKQRPSLHPTPLQMEARVRVKAPHGSNKFLAWQAAVLERLSERAEALEPGYGATAVKIHKAFVRCCLDNTAEGGSPTSSKDMYRAICAYHTMLTRVYGEDLILKPHVLPASALLCYDNPAHSTAAQALHMLRMTNRRYVVFTPAEAGEQEHKGNASQGGAKRATPPEATSKGATGLGASGPAAPAAPAAQSGKAAKGPAGVAPTRAKGTAVKEAVKEAAAGGDGDAGAAAEAGVEDDSGRGVEGDKGQGAARGRGAQAAASAPVAPKRGRSRGAKAGGAAASTGADEAGEGKENEPCNSEVKAGKSEGDKLKAEREEQGQAPATWAACMEDMWVQVQQQLKSKAGPGSSGGKLYRHVRASHDPLRFSCNIMDTLWQEGCVSKKPLPHNAHVMHEILSSEAGVRAGRLYFVDGTIPAYEAMGLPTSVPGICCHINNSTNAMLPHALRSSRGDSLFNFMKVESTGTACFVLFAPIGGGCNITAFHQETKKLRSFNCGAGDFIVQPLATAANVARMQQVHEAVVGRHRRHGQMLPLEFYLEEGIPLVLYIRDRGYSEMVELCQQSCHAFLTYNYAATKPVPSLKVSCNDWCLRWELGCTFFIEELELALGRYIDDEAPPPDGADTWTDSSYFCREPSTLRARQGWQRPWSDEVALPAAAATAAAAAAAAGPDAAMEPQAMEVDGKEGKRRVRGKKGVKVEREEDKEAGGQKGQEQGKEQGKANGKERDGEGEEKGAGGTKEEVSAEEEAVEDGGEEGEPEKEHSWRTAVIVVRTAERLVDLLAGRLTPQPFTGELPSRSAAATCLHNLLPPLLDMAERCHSEQAQLDHMDAAGRDGAPPLSMDAAAGRDGSAAAAAATAAVRGAAVSLAAAAGTGAGGEGAGAGAGAGKKGGDAGEAGRPAGASTEQLCNGQPGDAPDAAEAAGAAVAAGAGGSSGVEPGRGRAGRKRTPAAGAAAGRGKKAKAASGGEQGPGAAAAADPAADADVTEANAATAAAAPAAAADDALEAKATTAADADAGQQAAAEPQEDTAVEAKRTAARSGSARRAAAAAAAKAAAAQAAKVAAAAKAAPAPADAGAVDQAAAVPEQDGSVAAKQTATRSGRRKRAAAKAADADAAGTSAPAEAAAAAEPVAPAEPAEAAASVASPAAQAGLQQAQPAAAAAAAAETGGATAPAHRETRRNTKAPAAAVPAAAAPAAAAPAAAAPPAAAASGRKRTRGGKQQEAAQAAGQAAANGAPAPAAANGLGSGTLEGTPSTADTANMANMVKMAAGAPGAVPPAANGPGATAAPAATPATAAAAAVEDAAKASAASGNTAAAVKVPSGAAVANAGKGGKSAGGSAGINGGLGEAAAGAGEPAAGAGEPAAGAGTEPEGAGPSTTGSGAAGVEPLEVKWQERPYQHDLHFSKEYVQLVIKEVLEVLDEPLPAPLDPSHLPPLAQSPDLLLRYMCTPVSSRGAAAAAVEAAMEQLPISCSLPAEVLHSLWLFGIRREWEEAVQDAPRPDVLKSCRRRRARLEEMLDAHCTALCSQPQLLGM